MTEINKGDEAPGFCLPDSSSNEICLEVLRGKKIVLYFYPKDNTSGCTLEAKSFSENLEKFRGNNTIIIGVSPDSCESHEKFAEKNNLEIVLLSDPRHTVLEKYGVWKMKKLYGREYMGVERTTFLISEDGTIIDIWRKVRVKGHSDEVLERIMSLP